MKDVFGKLKFLALASLMLLSFMNAGAVPLFARQTGQACVSCHLGGMYPQLTAYGRFFKLTGYTLGTRPNLGNLEVQKDAPPISIWLQSGKQWYTNIPSGSGPAPSSSMNLQAVSLFAGGKIADNVGALLQWTGKSNGGGGFNSGVDMSEVRYAEHIARPDSDLIYGVYFNNIPSLSDVWNSTATWSGNFMGFFNSGLAPVQLPFLEKFGMGSAIGAGAYLYKDNTWYAEAAVYKSVTHGPFTTYFTGGAMGGTLIDPSPYYRFAFTKDFGPHSFELGLHGMVSYAHNGTASSGSMADWNGTINTYRDVGIDGQYQYNLDPHYFSAHVRYLHENASFATDQVGMMVSNASNVLNETYVDASYIYQAKYGAMLIYRSVVGTNDAMLYSANTLTGSPEWKSWTPEIFWMPWQNVRIGYQYIFYTEMAGTTGIIPGQSLSPHDFNTSMLYVSFLY
ncbi:MAG: hypothetical protein KGI82_00110 [Betaproteobacteria bacterium]|nr:hypothetical protein [Betaproteobacteria bacterium]